MAPVVLGAAHSPIAAQSTGQKIIKFVVRRLVPVLAIIEGVNILMDFLSIFGMSRMRRRVHRL